MAALCSLYSLSSANPSLPASLLMATTGKTTLISVFDTPRSSSYWPGSAALRRCSSAGRARPRRLNPRPQACPTAPAPARPRAHHDGHHDEGRAHLHGRGAAPKAPPGAAQRRPWAPCPPVRGYLQARLHRHSPSVRSPASPLVPPPVPPPSPATGPDAIRLRRSHQGTPPTPSGQRGSLQAVRPPPPVRAP